MKKTKRKIKFRNYKSKKYINKKRENKNHNQKLNKTKKLKGGVESGIRKSGRTKKTPERLIDETSKTFQKEKKNKEKIDKEKKELLQKKKLEKKKQDEINKVQDNPINKEILDKPVSEKDITFILEDNESPKPENKLKVNFRDIIVWKSISEIKKEIQRKLFGFNNDTQIDKKYLNKYGVLHKEIFKDTFHAIVLDYTENKFKKLKQVDDELNKILTNYIEKESLRIAKYPSVLSYLKYTFNEFKTYIFPQSDILKDYSLFSYLVNFYYNIEFNSKFNQSGVRFNDKVKKRLESLKEKLDKVKFIADYSEYQDILKKYIRLNGTELKNNDLIYSENYIGYQLTDEDITNVLSQEELNEYIYRHENELTELIQKTDERRRDERPSSSLRSNRSSDIDDD